VARSKSRGVTVAVESEGIEETLRAFSGLEKDLRKEANAELRVAAKKAAEELAGRLRSAAASSPTPVSRRLVSTIKVKSDRFPTVTIGGRKKVGATGAPAGRLLWGSEHGGANFGQPAGGSYWIAPTAAAFESSDAIATFRRAVYDVTKRYGLVI
jgi:hypothetical protein